MTIVEEDGNGLELTSTQTVQDKKGKDKDKSVETQSLVANMNGGEAVESESNSSISFVTEENREAFRRKRKEKLRRQTLRACCASLQWIFIALGFSIPLIATLIYFRNREMDLSSNNDVHKPYNNRDRPIYSHYPENGAKVEQIVLLGERNSGTNWVTSLLSSCFPTIPTSTYLKTWKHWFQHDDDLNYVNASTFVILAVQNPYDWIEIMRKVPRDFPKHMNLEWKEFVTKPWTMERGSFDKNKGFENRTDRFCQYHFKYNEVKPCMLSPLKMAKRKRAEKHRDDNKRMGRIKRHLPIWGTQSFEPPHNQTGASTPCYELNINGSGKPYESVVDMRRDKLLNHLNVTKWDWVKGLQVVQFDFMSNATYLQEFLRRVELNVGVDASEKCKFVPHPKTFSGGFNKSQEFVEWMNARVDWDVEALVGYFPYVRKV